MISETSHRWAMQVPRAEETPRETYIHPNYITSSFPQSQEIHTNATPTVPTEPMYFLLRRKAIASHFIPARDPLDILPLCENHQIAVAFADTAVAIFHRNMLCGGNCHDISKTLLVRPELTPDPET